MTYKARSKSRQAGVATLIVTIVLLALLTVTVLVVSQSVLLEIRTSSNTTRDKEALSRAQAAAEYGAMARLEDSSIVSGSIALPLPAGKSTFFEIVSAGGGDISATGYDTAEDDSAYRQVWEDYGIYTIGDVGDIPPLMAGGNFPPNGTFSIVANPNGGGSGVSVSAWTDTASGASGTWQTCNLDEYLYQGSNAGKTKTAFPNVGDGYEVCDDCNCKATDITHLCDAADVTNASDCPDIVDSTDSCIPNVFENLFNSVNITYSGCSGDETNAAGKGDGYESATDFLDDDSITIEIDSCNPSDLNSSSGEGDFPHGMPILWYKGSSNCDINQQVGTYEKPVVLVSQADTKINANAKFFGFLMVFHNCYDDADGECDASVPVPTITANGGAKIYGSLMVSKDVNLPTGGLTVIYAPNVEKALTNDGEGWEGLARVPGSWRDYE